jgi:hypothetical protein
MDTLQAFYKTSTSYLLNANCRKCHWHEINSFSTFRELHSMSWVDKEPGTEVGRDREQIVLWLNVQGNFEAELHSTKIILPYGTHNIFFGFNSVEKYYFFLHFSHVC